MTTSNEVPYGSACAAPTARRSLLRAVPALLIPAALGGPALVSAETPLLALFRESDDLMARWNGAPDEASDALSDEAVALEERIAAEPITCLADLAAKVVALSCYGDQGLHASVIAEAEAIVAGRLA